MIAIAAKVGAALAALYVLDNFRKTRGTIELAFDYQTCKCSRVEYHPDGRISRTPMPTSACVADGLDTRGCPDVTDEASEPLAWLDGDWFERMG